VGFSGGSFIANGVVSNMNYLNLNVFKRFFGGGFMCVLKWLCAVFMLCASIVMFSGYGIAASMTDYSITPPFLTSYVPPQVLFTLGKDHKFFYPAYNDASDIDGDGQLDIGYKHSIIYKGYFDPNKCYEYTTITGKSVFAPTSITATRYCDGTKWSGNFLNWLAMSRADIVKKVLYGGNRTRDTSAGIGETYLSGEGIPQDGHAWGKEYTGTDIQSLVPTANYVVNGHRALFCVVHNGKDNDDFILTSNSTPIAQMRMLPDMEAAVFAAYAARNGNTGLRIWDWVNVEMGSATSKNICSDTGIDTDGNGSINVVAGFPVQKFEVTAKVCDVNIGVEDNCKTYGGNTKPQGLMQQYGEASSSQKVCSKDMSTPCTSNSQCSSNGECVDKTNMYFGLMAGSYKNPKAGGYLRKNLWGISNETVSSTGLLQASDPDNKGLIMKSIEGLKCPAGTGYYPLSSHWGNPIGELMYEAMRYLGGKVTPTPEYVTGITSTSDAGLYASKPTWDNPTNLFPSCSIPFVLLFSDVYNSFDDDQIPGSTFATFTNSAGNLNNFNATTLANAISTNESKTSAIIGVSGTTAGANTDGLCTAKTINGFGEVKGICPAEADLQGTFYPAAAALYGRAKMKTEEGKANVLTYVVAFNSNIPEFTLNANGKNVTVMPMAKALADGTGVAEWSCTTGNFDFAVDATRGLTITPKTGTSGKCPTMAIVSVYVLDHKYDANNKLTYVRFKVSSDTLNGGSDYDMDGLAEYTLCAGPGVNGCNDGAVGADEVKVTVTAQSSAAGTNFAHGYVISGTGTTTDGVYLPVRKYNTNGNSTCGDGTLWWGSANLCTLPLTKTKSFTASTNNPGLLKNPLWYAAKYGGFKDLDGDGKPYTDATCATSTPNPKCKEWTTGKNGLGVPDTYFEVSNPSQLEQRLRDALDAILASVSSGTAASILNNSEGSGATLLQAVFYPKKIYENTTAVSWIGELMNLWYYVDPFFVSSRILEDSDYSSGNHTMNIAYDKRIQFYFDEADSQAKVKRSNLDGSTELADLNSDVTGGLKTLWSAGKLLWKRDISTDPRTIYTSTDGTSLTGFSTTNAASLYTLLNAEGADATAKTAYATNLIQYVHGVDVALNGAATRNRTVDIKISDSTTATKVWKLGDIISSTPKLQGGLPLQSYDQPLPLGYNDATYTTFYSTDTYKNRGMVYVGSNDGMLHAFKLGKLTISEQGNQKATLSGTNLGREEWTYIPKNVLPYMKYLTLLDYENNHLFSVDGATFLFDIATKTTAARDDYWNETRTATTWNTVLLGGMGIGGASKNFGYNCTDKVDTGTCVKTPIADTGYSSYYALDISNQDFVQDSNNNLREQPNLKWEFNHADLGFTTSGPAIIRIKPKPAVKDDTSNGRWFAIYASGPTGPIDTAKREFKGKSSQYLKLFVVDIEKGPVVNSDPVKNGLWVIDTGITEAFASTISNNAVLDAEVYHATDSTDNGKNLRQDDVVYIGYTKKKTSDGTWTDGGVLRLVIPDTTDPDYMNIGSTTSGSGTHTPWITTKVIDGIGPVTTSIAKLISKNNLYLFFGTGRYFYSQDDSSSTRHLVMVKDKCYPQNNAAKNIGTYVASDISTYCYSTVGTPDTLALTDLTNRTTAATAAVTNGWYITLDAGERVVTDTVATVNGAIYYTVYKPSTGICSFGGKSYLWGTKYDTGEALPASAKKGKVVIQLSTGSFAEIDLANALTDKEGRRTTESSTMSFGKASADSGLFITSAGLTPVKKVLHIQERFK
jgi:type IV pilus assembly protein PilY1